jgi:hypothetical protein
MRTRLTTLVKAFVACTLLVASVDCGVKEYANCHTICDKKRECGSDSSYDVGNCTDYCSTNANNDAEYARKVDTCKECVSPLACGDYKVASCLINCPSLP